MKNILWTIDMLLGTTNPKWHTYNLYEKRTDAKKAINELKHNGWKQEQVRIGKLRRE